MTIVRLSVAAVLVAGAMALMPHLVSAAPATPQSSALGAAAAEGSPIEQVQWGRCRYWRNVCAARWGWRTPPWFGCMARHAC
jgi:hypothetical protein